MAAKTKTVAKKRQVKASTYKSFKLSKRMKSEATKPLPGSIRLFQQSLRHLKKYWPLFLGIVFIYLVLTIVLVKGLGVGGNIAQLKTTFQTILTGGWGQLTTGLALFVFLLTSASSGGSSLAGLYQAILLVVVSLAVIWALRQSHGKVKPSVRDAFYKGMYPLIPFLLVLSVIVLELIPIFVSVWLYLLMIPGGIAITGAEQAVTWAVVGLMVLTSLYLVSSSVLALYIVTLPDMKPLQALRSAGEIVRYRRWTVIRRVIALPIILVLLGAAIMVPLILFVTPIAEWTFFILNMLVLAVVHAYFYRLYRELI